MDSDGLYSHTLHRLITRCHTGTIIIILREFENRMIGRVTGFGLLPELDGRLLNYWTYLYFVRKCPELRSRGIPKVLRVRNAYVTGIC